MVRKRQRGKDFAMPECDFRVLDEEGGEEHDASRHFGASELEQCVRPRQGMPRRRRSAACLHEMGVGISGSVTGCPAAKIARDQPISLYGGADAVYVRRAE